MRSRQTSVEVELDFSPRQEDVSPVRALLGIILLRSLYRSVYCTMLYYAILYYIMLYYIVLCYILLYCIVLCYMILH